ncbi:HtaA domain-containing protein [Streptomyces sp. O3]
MAESPAGLSPSSGSNRGARWASTRASATRARSPKDSAADCGNTALKPKSGLLTVAEAPAKLTADGARASGSLYKAGTGMGPVSLAVALTEGAELPALPDLGSSAAPTTPTPEPAASDATPSAAARPWATGPDARGRPYTCPSGTPDRSTGAARRARTGPKVGA